jgi:hypothetical protein
MPRIAEPGRDAGKREAPDLRRTEAAQAAGRLYGYPESLPRLAGVRRLLSPAAVLLGEIPAIHLVACRKRAPGVAGLFEAVRVEQIESSGKASAESRQRPSAISRLRARLAAIGAFRQQDRLAAILRPAGDPVRKEAGRPCPTASGRAARAGHRRVPRQAAARRRQAAFRWRSSCRDDLSLTGCRAPSWIEIDAQRKAP